MQASGRLAEARFAQLRCSEEESVQLLAALAPAITPPAARCAAEHYGGWAAALQLAGLAARVSGAQTDVPPLTDEQDRLVDEYLWHEAFRAERPELVDLLLDIAVVERVNPHLLEALTLRGDAFPLLEEAEQRGLFLHRLDAVGWFQLHELVREALVREADRRAPGRLAEQHGRAARWFEEAGEDTAALDHWLAAGRPRQALALLARTALALYDVGHEATLRRVLDALPPGAADGDVAALLDLAWCQMFVSTEQFQRTVEETLVVAASAGTTGVLWARAEVLQAVASLTTGDWEAARGQVTDALRSLGADAWSDPIARYGWNLLAHATALNEEWRDDERVVREVKASVGRDVDRSLRFEGTRALGLALAGRPVDALRVAAGVSRSAAGRMTVLRNELTLADALARRELGDAAGADAALEELARSPEVPTSWTHALAGLDLVEARLADGDLDAADAAFERVAALAATEGRGRGGLTAVARVGTRLALARGAQTDAARWAAQVDDAFWGPVSLARVSLAEDDRARAEALLERAEARCARHEVVRGLLRARAARNAEAALKLAGSAVEAAAEAGLLHTVVAEGPAVAELVERAAWSVPQDWLDRWRRASARRRPAAATLVLPERLTERELDVLRLLSSRLTLREIADELYVSINTLKFHLRVIYRKLGVGSRAEAVEIAQAGRASAAPQPGASLRR
jgi:LuxR family maltose regulon positive regulatory protein